MQIIQILCDDHPDIVKPYLENYIKTYVSQFTWNVDEIVVAGDQSQSNYDALCVFFKLKMRLYCKNKCVYMMISENMVDTSFSEQDYFQFLWKNLEDMHDNSIKIDVVTHCLQDFLNNSRNALSELSMEKLSSFNENIVNVQCGMNTRFKWADLLTSLQRV
jgi:hypothetical protein